MTRRDHDVACREERILVLATKEREALLASDVLDEAGFSSTICRDVADFSTKLTAGAGAALLTEAACVSQVTALIEALDDQPAWSDVPLVVLISPGSNTDHMLDMVEALGPSGNETVLERPVRVPTLVSVLQSAVRARRRQYEVRDLIAQLEDANATLEERVAVRTDALEERNQQVRSLISALTAAEQSERERISNVLHDHLQQLLVALQLRARVLNLKLKAQEPNAEASEKSGQLHEMDELIEEAITTTRKLTAELNPPVLNSPDMKAALQYLAFWMEDMHGLQVELDVDDACHISSKDLRILLFQLVREVLFNVVKHAGVEQARTRAFEEEDYLIIQVEDEGSGFDPQQVEGAHERDGLGVHRIRERLHALGGRMEIDSAPGTGTRVTIRAPLKQAVPPVEKDLSFPASLERRTEEPVEADQKIRVLLVDDHDIVRDGLRILLGDYLDLTLVGEAADGQAAVAMVDELHPDVVVMDISMPELSGIEATRRISAKALDTRVVALTSYHLEDVEDSVRGAGAAACLPKRCSTETLVAAIRRAARRPLAATG